VPCDLYLAPSVACPLPTQSLRSQSQFTFSGSYTHTKTQNMAHRKHAPPISRGWWSRAHGPQLRREDHARAVHVSRVDCLCVAKAGFACETRSIQFDNHGHLANQAQITQKRHFFLICLKLQPRTSGEQDTNQHRTEMWYTLLWPVHPSDIRDEKWALPCAVMLGKGPTTGIVSPARLASFNLLSPLRSSLPYLLWLVLIRTGTQH